VQRPALASRLIFNRVIGIVIDTMQEARATELREVEREPASRRR
jgi:hypothetical protein